MWTSAKYYTDERVADLSKTEQVNMLIKHAKRQRVEIIRFEEADNWVFALTSETTFFTVTSMGKKINIDKQ